MAIASMAEWLRVWDTLAMLKLWSAGGREFDPRPGHYSIGRVFSPTRQLVCFSHLNSMPFFPNSEFIQNVVLAVKH